MPEMPRKLENRSATVAIIGAGPLGRWLALSAARAGFRVLLEDVMPANLHHAQEYIRGGSGRMGETQVLRLRLTQRARQNPLRMTALLAWPSSLPLRTLCARPIWRLTACRMSWNRSWKFCGCWTAWLRRGRSLPLPRRGCRLPTWLAALIARKNALPLPPKRGIWPANPARKSCCALPTRPAQRLWPWWKIFGGGWDFCRASKAKFEQTANS